MKKITFLGSGLNGSSFRAALKNSTHDPSGLILPFGVSWPFGRLTINEDLTEFKMPYGIRKETQPLNTSISLSRLGYLHFKTSNQTGDFGFSTFKMQTLIRELKARGYRLDETCERNLYMGVTVISVLTVIGFVAFIIGAFFVLSGSQGI